MAQKYWNLNKQWQPILSEMRWNRECNYSIVTYRTMNKAPTQQNHLKQTAFQQQTCFKCYMVAWVNLSKSLLICTEHLHSQMIHLFGINRKPWVHQAPRSTTTDLPSNVSSKHSSSYRHYPASARAQVLLHNVSQLLVTVYFHIELKHRLWCFPSFMFPFNQCVHRGYVLNIS